MKHFLIKELENFSGVKAHTVRVWERRYGLLKPKRSNGNTRHYDLDEVRLLLNISLLNQNGHKISSLVLIDPTMLQHEAARLSGTDNKIAYVIHKLIDHMFSSNIFAFEKELDECCTLLGIDATIQKVIMPFLEKVNLLSYDDTSNEVHFVVTALRRKLILGIEEARPGFDMNKAVLLFLPEKEHFDLVLLYMNYIMKKLGYRILYLGTNVPLQNLVKINTQKKPDIFCTYAGSTKQPKRDEFFSSLNKHLPGVKVFVAGAEKLLEEKPANENIFYFHYNDCERLL